MESLKISKQKIILVLNALKIVELALYQCKRTHRYLHAFSVHLLTFYLKINALKKLILQIHSQSTRVENLQIYLGVVK